MLSRIGNRHKKSWSTMTESIGFLADDNSSFRNADGHKIICRSWTPEGQPRYVRNLTFMHFGTNEESNAPHDALTQALHCLSHNRHTRFFAHPQTKHLGHGKSEGPRAIVDSVDTYVQDLFTHLDTVRQRYPGRPVYLFGHSMGGLLVAAAALKRPKDFAGIVMMAPLLAMDKEQATWFRTTMARFLGRIVPNLPISSLDLSLVSKDPAVVNWMTQDPLRYHGLVRVGWAAAILKALEEVQSKMETFEVPFLIQHGSADKLCDLGGSELFFKKALSKDKTIKVYNDSYHNLLMEPDGVGDQVLKDIAEWYATRVPEVSQQT
ncbi:unnamed protein product [Ixodes persulcatus]